MRQLSCLLAGLSVIGAAIAISTPASAQQVEELTVMGRHPKGAAGEASYAVSYRDLDLVLGKEQKELRRRVNLTAGYVCKKLGESPTSGCREKAVADAEPQVQKAIAAAKAHKGHWKRGPAWTPPPAA